LTVVVGADGFIGTTLLRALSMQGRRTVAVARQGRIGASPAIEPAPPDSPQRYADLLRDASAVVWLACSTTPGSSAGDPLGELEGNLRPLLAFLEAWQERPECRLLFVSTGGAMYGDVAGGLAIESNARASKSYYSAGKIAAEQFISSCCQQFGGSATILRPSNVYGCGQAYRPGFGIVPTAFHALVHDLPFTVWGDGSTTRDYLDIDDFVALCVRAIDRPVPPLAHAFNASSGQGTSVHALLALIEAVTGRTLRREHLPARAVDVSRIVLDNSAARAAFDWQPAISLEHGLAKAWHWFTAHAG
jgi:UDP-glucose 4-epimerase